MQFNTFMHKCNGLSHNMIVSIPSERRRSEELCRRLSGLICAILLMLLYTVPANAIDVEAGAAVLMDSVTGKVLYEKNGYAQMGMASTTKIMTAILALENGNLSDIVTVSDNAAGLEGTSMYLTAGEKVTLENLVYGLMLPSGNDAAIAIAEHIAGSVDTFVERMNRKAEEIGAVQTHFANPHGLYDAAHYTTAYDLALISRYAMQNPTFAQVVSTSSRTVPWEGHAEPKWLINANKLLKLYDGSDGIKPGYTPETGRTLVGSATRDGWRVITVTLNCGNDWEEHKKMFDYAFRMFRLQRFAYDGMPMSTVRVKNGAVAEVPIGIQGEYASVKPINTEIQTAYRVNAKWSVNAPIEKGQQLGTVVVRPEGMEEKEFPVVALEAVQYVKEPGLWNRFSGWVKETFGF